MTFGEELKEERLKRYLSQEEFAHFIGVTRVTYIRWEHDLTTPRITQMRKIKEALKKEYDCR